jgi:methylmalonyl-CoA/ethylmalonyl-CoA epimerase
MKKLEHIGIAVRNLEESEALFTRLLGIAPYKREAVESEGVITSFFELNGVKFELLAATSEESPIAKFLEKKGEGLHHLAFEVNGIQQRLNALQEQGFELIHPQPKDGADNKRIAFLHPKSTGGVLTELCEDRGLTDSE